MQRILGKLVLAGALNAVAWAADAQDVEAGRDIAREVCRPCHVVTTDQLAPRKFIIGPDFKDVANTSGTTATSLRVFLTTSHPKMPNLILTPQQSADVIAYILSLRDRP